MRGDNTALKTHRYTVYGAQRVTEPERDKNTMKQTTSRETQQWMWHRRPERNVEMVICRVSTFRDAREYGGTLPSYFPEMIPQANGDHVIAPTPDKK